MLYWGLQPQTHDEVRCTVKWSALVAASAVTMVLAACGTETAPTGGDPSTSTGGVPSTSTGSPTTDTSAVVDATGELVAHGILMQSEPDGEVEICIGGVAESLPPQCDGPVLEGEFSWEEVDARSQGGVTWTDEGYYAVGRYTPGEAFAGTITLTRPVSADPPEGFTPPERDDTGFPQLCDDPTADVPDVDQSERTQGMGGFDEEQALQERLQTLDGYVTSWVSDGGPLMNVVVTSDPEVARAALREVFSGPLCVVQRDLPTEEDVLAAQDALTAEWTELQLLSAGSGGVTGVPEVYVTVADQATVDRIHELVSPWLAPDQIVINSALVPLNG